MHNLIISAPQHLNELCDIPPDGTHWDAPHDYVKTKQGRSPLRPRAPFSWQKSLLPLSAEGERLATIFGLYMIAVNIPVKAFYVGIAAEGGKSPEGCLSRFRKHRVKLTGSNVGRTEAGSPQGVGGVNHTAHRNGLQGWRILAQLRYATLSQKGLLPDTCADVRIATASLQRNDKGLLEAFEAQIFSGDPSLRNRVFQLFWPGEDTSSVFDLTSSTRKPPKFAPGEVTFPSIGNS